MHTNSLQVHSANSVSFKFAILMFSLFCLLFYEWINQVLTMQEHTSIF